jgi:hypothetical protein
MSWYVDRNSGAITGVYACQQYQGQEEVADDAADVAAFLTKKPPAQLATAGQLIRALSQLGLLTAVDAAVAQADALTQRLWARAPEFPRNDPMVSAIAQAIGKTQADLDNVFALAVTL